MGSSILAMVGAALGAWLAATLAFRRYTKERSLDRIVDWHERVTLALQRMQRQIEAVAYWAERPRHEVELRAAEQALIIYAQEFMQVTGQRVLYGFSDGQLYVADAERIVDNLSSSWQSHERDVLPNYDLSAAAELMWRAAHQIGVDLRKQLGLKQHLWEGSYSSERELRSDTKLLGLQ